MHKILSSAVVMSSVVVIAVGTAAAQTAKVPAGGVPTFEVDSSWPKVPAKLHSVRVYETPGLYVDYFGDAR